MMPLHRLAALLSFSWILGLLIILTTPAANSCMSSAAKMKKKKNHSSILVWTYNVCAVGNLPNSLVILRSTPTSQIIHELQQLREKMVIMWRKNRNACVWISQRSQCPILNCCLNVLGVVPLQQAVRCMTLERPL